MASGGPPNILRPELEDREERRRDMLQGSLMVTASLIAASTYQAAVNPPEEMKKNTDSASSVLFRTFNLLSFAQAVATMMQLLILKTGMGTFRVMKIIMGINLLWFSASFTLTISGSWTDFVFYAAVPFYSYLLLYFLIGHYYKSRDQIRELRQQQQASTAAAAGGSPFNPPERAQ